MKTILEITWYATIWLMPYALAAVLYQVHPMLASVGVAAPITLTVASRYLKGDYCD